MGRKGRREPDQTSAGAVIMSVLSVMLFVGLAAFVVYLKAQRRAGRDPFALPAANRGGGNAPQPFNPGPQNDPFPKPEPKVLTPGVRKTEPTGGIFANIDYSEYRDDGAILIGFEIGLGKVPDTAVVTYLRPIWLTPTGERLGTAYGRTATGTTTVKARDGYAVGGIWIKGGGAIEGLCLTFMRRGEKHLLADDAYLSAWYGEQTRKPPGDLRTGDGGFVIGIHGKRFEDKGGVEFHDCGGIGTIGFDLWVRE